MTRKKKRNLRITNENDVREWKERREKRFKEENEVLIEWDNHEDPKINSKIHAFTQDLSVGGAKILTKINFPLHTTFMITLTLSRSEQIIKVAAKVNYINPIFHQDLYEIGLEFGHDFPQSIEGLIRHLFGHEYPQDVDLEMAHKERPILRSAS